MSKELFKIIESLPRGSKIYRVGSFALVFLTPDDKIIRISKREKRLNHPNVLQPFSSETTKNYLIEVLPKVKTLDSSFGFRRVKAHMKRQGLRICDWKRDNFGVLPDGKIVAIDPGAVVLHDGT